MTADLISYHFTRSAFFRRAEAPQSGPRSRAIQPPIIITRLNSGSPPIPDLPAGRLLPPKPPVPGKPTGPIRESNRGARVVPPRPPRCPSANHASAFPLSLGPSWGKPLPRHPRLPASASPSGSASIPGLPPTPSVPSGAAGSTRTSFSQRIEVNVFDRHPRAMLAVLTAAPLGLAHALPIGRPVAGPPNPSPSHDLSHPPHPIPFLPPPVPIDSPGHPA